MKNRTKNQNSDLIYLYISFVISIFAVSGQLIQYFFPNSIVKFIVVISASVVVLFSINSLVIPKRDLMPVVLLFFMGALIFYNDNFWGLYDIAIFCLMLIICFYSIRNGRWIPYYFIFTIIAYVFYAAFTILLYFNRDLYVHYVVDLFPASKNRLLIWYEQGCMAGLTDHYSTNAMFLALGLMILTSKFFFQDKKSRKKSSILIILVVVALLLTGKRGQVLFSVLSLFVVYYISLKSSKTVNRFIKIFGIFLVGASLLFLTYQLFPNLFTFVYRFQNSIDTNTLTSNRSDLLWPIAIDAFKKNPIFGIGWCQYTYNLSTQIGGESAVYHTHNIYLQLLCETGIFGFTIYVIWMLWNIISTYKVYCFMINSKTIYTKELFYITFSFSFQIFFILYGITGNPLYDEEMFIPYFVSCAINIFFRNNLYVMSKSDDKKF